MKIAGVTVEPGASTRHSIELIELADGTRVFLPLLLLNGARPGPRLYLGAAIHGDEVNGVEILSRALSKVNPAQFAGSVVCVPVQNPLAFQGDHRHPVALFLKSPLDQAPIDPWSCFPGNKGGNFTEKLAALLFGLITQCDYAIDLHTPTRGGRYVPISILPHPSLPAFAQAEALAEAFGSGYIMKTEKGMYVSSGILCVEATRAGVPCFTFEIGEGGRLEEDLVSLGEKCVLNVLRHLKMLPGEVEKPAHTVRMKDFVALRAGRGGLLHTKVQLGARVRKGDALAQVVSIYGDELETISAPMDAVFVRSTTLSTVSAGERVATLGLL
jgi:predicted deacylase